MLKNIIIVLCFLSPLVAFAAKPIVANELEIVNPLTLTQEGQIQYFSKLYGANINIVKKVIECESGGNHKTVGDSGLSNGVFQFQKSTFYRMAKIYGKTLDYSSEYDQIRLGIWAMSQPELAKEWTTYVAIQKGGSYSFYSRQLSRNFTVVCKL